MARSLILGVIDFHIIVGIILPEDFPLRLKIIKTFITQKAIVYHANNLFALRKYFLRMTHDNIKIGISREATDIGVSGKELLIRILNTEKHDRNLQRQRISTGKKGIESLIARCDNQIGLPLTSAFAETVHYHFLRLKCPKISVQIFCRNIHLHPTFPETFHQTLIKVIMPRSL